MTVQEAEAKLESTIREIREAGIDVWAYEGSISLSTSYPNAEAIIKEGVLTE